MKAIVVVVVVVVLVVVVVATLWFSFCTARGLRPEHPPSLLTINNKGLGSLGSEYTKSEMLLKSNFGHSHKKASR